MVGIDGSESSKDALRWAARQAELTGAHLTATTVWHLPEIYAYVSRDYGADARNMPEAVLKEVLGSDAPVHVDTQVGHPASVLIEASREAALLVVGTRGHGAFEGMLLGSVSQHCVQHSACPVVVVPHQRN